MPTMHSKRSASPARAGLTLTPPPDDEKRPGRTWNPDARRDSRTLPLPAERNLDQESGLVIKG